MDNGDNQFIGHNSICDNYNSVEQSANNLACEEPEKSEDDTFEGLRRQDATQMCKYTKSNETMQDFPKCGFNKNGDAWCNKRKGDQWFIKALDQLKGVNFTSLNCHTSSTVET